MEHWTQKEFAFTETSSMWPVQLSSKLFSQYSHCDNLPLMTTSPGLPYSYFFQFFVKSQNTLILIESNYSMRIYVPYILNFKANVKISLILNPGWTHWDINGRRNIFNDYGCSSSREYNFRYSRHRFSLLRRAIGTKNWFQTSETHSNSAGSSTFETSCKHGENYFIENDSIKKNLLSINENDKIYKLAGPRDRCYRRLYIGHDAVTVHRRPKNWRHHDKLSSTF